MKNSKKIYKNNFFYNRIPNTYMEEMKEEYLKIIDLLKDKESR